MSSSTTDASQRAETLASRAIELIEQGNLTEASKVLREASSLGTGNASVIKALNLLQNQDGGVSVVRLCRTWLPGGSSQDDIGEEILDYLHKNAVSDAAASDAMEALLEYRGDEDMADHITGELLKLSGARKYLASELVKEPTRVFDDIFIRGDDSMDRLTDMLFDKSCWPSDKERVAAERDAFQLALAQMMRAGQDHPERAMKCISRLLASENKNLGGLIDADGFDVILSQLDIRAPNILKTHATVATAKLLELSQETSQTLISQYVIKRVERPSGDGLVLAFSAAAAVFPMAPTAAAQLFLNPGFLNSFEPLVRRFKSSRVEQAALEFLNAACIDKACREAIQRYCLTWVNEVARSEESSDKKQSGQASVILIKLGHDGSAAEPTVQGEQTSKSLPIRDAKAQAALVSRFKSLIKDQAGKTGDRSVVNEAVEGLAYATISPATREDLAKDAAFLKSFLPLASEKSLVYGILTSIVNITKYLPQMSEEQKKVSQLKTYANAQKPRAPDLLEEDKAVAGRCSAIMKAGLVSILVSRYKDATPAVRVLSLQCLDNLSREKQHRGALAQQGAVKLLVQMFDKFKEDKSDETSSLANQQKAAHTLARILISVNPNHVFGSSGLPLTSAIRPLTSLLQSSEDNTGENATLLSVFESLLALTNLASTDDAARLAIINQAWTSIENLLLHSNNMIQRAAVELTCNLCASGPGVAKFADGSTQANNRLHILLALADVDDLPTRRAATGALAMLTEWDAAVTAVLDRERGVKILLELCGDESEEIRHRAVVCVRNLAFAPGKKLEDRGRVAIKKEGGVDTLRDLVMKTKVKEIMQAALEVLQVLA